MDVPYTIRKLRHASINEIFGFNPLDDAHCYSTKVAVTPHFNLYLLPSEVVLQDKSFYQLPVPLVSPKKNFTKIIDPISLNSFKRDRIDCPGCFKTFLMTDKEFASHIAKCQ
jgi:hypothetical protein